MERLSQPSSIICGGLCPNYQYWLIYGKEIENTDSHDDFLEELFYADDLSSSYPFDVIEYEKTYLYNKSEQPERLAWVKKTITELES